MGRVSVFMIGKLFIRGRVQGETHQLVECVFDVGTLVLEYMNRGIELANVGIESLDVLLILDVLGNQCIEFLGVGGFHLGRDKNGQAGSHWKKLQVRVIMVDGENRVIKWDRWKIRVSGRMGGTTKKNANK